MVTRTSQSNILRPIDMQGPSFGVGGGRLSPTRFTLRRGSLTFSPTTYGKNAWGFLHFRDEMNSHSFSPLRTYAPYRTIITAGSFPGEICTVIVSGIFYLLNTNCHTGRGFQAPFSFNSSEFDVDQTKSTTNTIMSMSEANALMLQATAELEAQSPKPGTDKGDPTRRATSTFPSLSGHPSPTGRSSMLPEITQLNIHEPSSPISPLNNTRCIPVGDAQKEAVEVTEREVEIGPENTLNENGAVMQKLNSNYTTTEEERIRPERRYRRMHISLRTGFRWSYLIMAVIIIALLVIIIALSVEISKPNENHGTSTTSDTVLVIQDFSPGDAPPLVDSPVDTVDVIFGTYYGLASNRPQQKVVYNSAGGKICIRTKLGGAWLGSVRCILNANPKNNTPLTILDWAAGPSIYYITTDNKLSGVDNVPANDTWVLSSIAKQNVAVHPQSQINSLTWLNGSSTWVGYQDITGQVREFGLDDYRDQNLWRQSSGGSLGIAINGSFLSATRYSIGPNEFEEAGFQVDSNIIHLKRYANGAWGTEEYAVDGTISGFAAGAAFSITNIVNPTSTGESTILIAFMTTDGYITIQTRGTVNITDFSAFSKAVKIAQNDGNADAGLAVDGSSGTPKLVVMDKQSILEYTSDAAATNWTAPTTITT